jgi:hypothetical protein
MRHRPLFVLVGVCALCACSTREAELEPRSTEPTQQARRTDSTAARGAASATAESAAEKPLPYPVRWSEDLKLASLADVEASLAKNDALGFGELKLADQRVLPTNCKQWAELRHAGYEPTTSLEVQADGGALFQCEVLRLLKHVRPARVSFVRELPKGGRELLGTLPALVATAESPEQGERLAPLVKQRAALAAFDPRARIVKSVAPDVTRIAEGDGQSIVDIQPKAWGDFNDDGVDDVVLAVRNSMTKGSLSTARVMLVTRSTATEVLRVIDGGGERR